MRYHLTLRGKKTTITISDDLNVWLTVKIIGKQLLDMGLSPSGKSARLQVQKWINTRVLKEEEHAPREHISQWVHSLILRELMPPDVQALRAKLEGSAASIVAEAKSTLASRSSHQARH
ncbi:hypothetical protein [Burkholderia anthina]|uniref:hypothetical protein n=1 Tax=Burkholderia anthina TaxID=179879 RepID=UPI001AA01CD7|nr:hypothetical protein [Burkholderia anthina]QTD95624.1 hypothetical protein J4G50_38965 [Burkholderia anthina]QTD95646.1 hypothetical protein J4G50_39095 [Burkholderia anthina]